MNDKPVRTCSVEGCERKLIARGLCSLHYQQAQRSGVLPDRERRELHSKEERKAAEKEYRKRTYRRHRERYLAHKKVENAKVREERERNRPERFCVCGQRLSGRQRMHCSRTCECRADYQRHREDRLRKLAAYKEANAEAVKERQRAYYWNNRDELRVRAKIRYESGYKVKCREYALSHADQIKERMRVWRKENPEKLREIGKRARIKNWRKIVSMRRDAYSAKNPLLNVRSRNDSRRESARQRFLLNDGYIRSMLRSKGFPKQALTPEYIEMQRLIIKIKRTAKKGKSV